MNSEELEEERIFFFYFYWRENERRNSFKSPNSYSPTLDARLYCTHADTHTSHSQAFIVGGSALIV